MSAFSFQTNLEIIGINPFVQIPESILSEVFVQAGKNKGYIPIKGTINTLSYHQTLVKYAGLWRLYINTTMLKNSPKRIGKTIEFTIEFDPSDRTIEPLPLLLKTLNENPVAKKKFESLTPSLKKEIMRYIAALKTEESRTKNTEKAIQFLLGKESFIGRKPLK